MHRSGTSALAAIFDAMGVHGGVSKMQAATDNPRGFYENTSVVDINEEILLHNHTRWDDVEHIRLQWNNTFIEKAKKLITKEYGRANTIYLKDPRISLLIPFWEKVFEELGYRVCNILIVRQPSEIVASLSKRNNFSTEKSIALIQKYWLGAIEGLEQSQVVVLKFSDLHDSHDGLLEQLNKVFGWVPYVNIEHSSVIDKSLKSRITNQNIDQHSYDYLNDLYHAIDNHTGDSIASSEALRRLKSLAPIPNIQNIRRTEQEEINFCKVYFDSGSGYSENNSIKVLHDGKQLSASLDSSTYSNSTKIRIVPIHSQTSFYIKNLELWSGKEGVNYKISHNCSVSEDGLFTTYNNDTAAIEITLPEASKLTQLDIEISFDRIPRLTKKPLSENKLIKSKSALLIQSIFLFLSQPTKFLKHLNAENFRTLKSALRRENPQTIFRNLKRLIISNNVQQSEDINQNNKLNPRINERDTLKKSNYIVYICGELPEYDKSSGAQRAEKILSLLSESAEVYVLYNKSSSKYIEYYRDKGIAAYKFNAFKEKYNTIASNVVAVVFNKYYTYHDYKLALDWFPDARKVIDAEDIAWVREERSVKYTDLTQEDVLRNKSNEIAAYRAVDQIWCVTKDDEAVLRNELPDADISIVSNIHKGMVMHYVDHQNKTILFFANYSHEPNVSALQELVTVVFPQVRKSLPEVRLVIAGSSIDRVMSIIPNDSHIDVMGYIEHADIPKLYSNAAVVIAPLKFGSGVKGKITEAISYRVPVITNAIGNEGIDLVDKESGFITEDSHDMASYAVDIMNGDYDINTITQAASNKIKNLVSYNNNKLNILNSLYAKVSICIVTYNRLDLLQSCIESILQYTNYPNYEILIYSNGCSDGTQDYIEKLQSDHSNIRSILSDDNKVFVEPNNILMELAGYTDIVLLNNDVEVTDSWLSELRHSARLNEVCGIVGAKILYPDGRLQEYGSEVYADGSGANIGKGDDPNDQAYSKIQSVSYVSGCCMYIKRSTIGRIGKFDMTYAPCYYEDSDYCYRAWQSGITTIVTPKSIIIHKEGASAGTDLSVGFKKYQSINRAKFLELHGQSIEKINAKARMQSDYKSTI